MKLTVKFSESIQSFEPQFGEVHILSDGGYEKGYAVGEAAGYEKGHTDGMTEGIEQGYADGYSKGETEGYSKGQTDGYTEGEKAGYSKGYDTGNAEGYAEGHAEGHATGYSEGETAGYTKGQADGIEQGKQAEYDAFWDSYQSNGLRTDYYGGFEREGWTNVNFFPKYDMKPTSCHLMFQYSQITNLAEILRTCGVVLDTSKSTGLNNMFYMSKVTHVPTIDFTSATSALTGVFANCPVKTIEKIILKADGSNTFTNTFQQATSLEDITIEGVIGNTISFANCYKLTDASVNSIIAALKDLTGATAQKVQFSSGVSSNLTDEQLATIWAKNWTT